MTISEKPMLHIVYDGVGLAGKTSSMAAVQRRLANASPLQSWKTHHGAQRVEFSASNSDLILSVHGILGAVWSPPDWHEERASADAIVFVVDSQPPRMPANEEWRDMIEASFEQMGRMVPIVLQFNKRDMVTASWSEYVDGRERPHTAPALSLEHLSRSLNRWSAPEFSSVAVRDEGVWEAFQAAALLCGRAHGLERYVSELLAESRKG
jgi:hypothetical protein